MIKGRNTMSEVRSELKYLPSHEWARVEEDGTVTVGISDNAQSSLGDVVYVEVPEVGSEVSAGDQAGVVESVKAASDIYSPISGVVIAINEVLEDEPETVNSSPYDDGWFYKVKPFTLDDLADALDADAYSATLED
ncbi:MAG: glycine cleavage system H protein [Granulosicoccus sp.]|jgi:glycine cleavage system H protein